MTTEIEKFEVAIRKKDAPYKDLFECARYSAHYNRYFSTHPESSYAADLLNYAWFGWQAGQQS